ncbi:MAG: rhodanese-like domain-containing protein [Pseudomonadota bacterium]
MSHPAASSFGRRRFLVAAGLIGLALPVAASRWSSARAEAVARPEAIDVATAAKLHEDGVLFVDIRRPAEFADGCIPCAINVELKNFDARWLEGLIEAEEPFVVYSSSQRCRRGSLCARRALGFGYAGVFLLEQGLAGWKGAGLPVEFPG